MIVVNLWFVKHSNGLFHYGLDYAAALGDAVREIWVRDASLARLVTARLPAARVRVLGARALPRALIALGRRRDALFTPTPHPLALVPRQTVVVHDSFPFEGRPGRLKRRLFRAGLFASRAVAGYINHADARRFIDGCGIPPGRTRYLPNRIGVAADAIPDPAGAGRAVVGDRIVVGLFGSDSPKKKYDALFAAIAATWPRTPIEWRIFGHENAYTRRLRDDHPRCAIEVVGSDVASMDDFLAMIDFAVSVAEGEGFARPVALSLQRGIPTLLLDTPVFREFYGGSARLFPTVDALVAALASLAPGDRLDRPALASADALRADFAAGVDWLAGQGGGR